MDNLKLHKQERLCSRTVIDNIFAHGHSVTAYPLRAVYRCSPAESPAMCLPRLMITIPKKKIRRAVGRVLMRRRTREAYRLHRRALLVPALQTAGQRVDVAFVYLSKQLVPYAVIDDKMREILTAIGQRLEKTKP